MKSVAEGFAGRIVFVPGKNPKPDPLLHQALLWRALHTGLAATQPECAGALRAENFVIAPWNRLYYGADKDATPDFEAIERVLTGNWDEDQDRREASSWRVKVQRAARGIADRYPALMKLAADPAIRDTIAETARYFDRKDGMGRRVREVIKVLLRRWLLDGRPILVIGHSLGSVITWDALWELTHEERVSGKIDLITMGSPLGLQFTQARICGHGRKGADRYPSLIRSWHNIAAEGDLISLDPTLADDFAEMRELGLVERIEDHHEGVFTHYRDEAGLNPHRSFGYLVHPVMSACVAVWWRRFK